VGSGGVLLGVVHALCCIDCVAFIFFYLSSSKFPHFKAQLHSHLLYEPLHDPAGTSQEPTAPFCFPLWGDVLFSPSLIESYVPTGTFCCAVVQLSPRPTHKLAEFKDHELYFIISSKTVNPY